MFLAVRVAVVVVESDPKFLFSLARFEFHFDLEVSSKFEDILTDAGARYNTVRLGCVICMIFEIFVRNLSCSLGLDLSS